MVLKVWDFVSVLSRLHWAFLFATAASVVVGDALAWLTGPSSTISEHLPRIIYHLAWFPIAVLIMARVIRHDRSSAEQSVDPKLEGALKEMQALREQHERAITSFRNEIVAIDTNMRAGFEELGYPLSSRRVLVQAGAAAGDFRTSVPAVSVRRPGRIERFRDQVERYARGFWRWFWGSR